jgi:hypothetical protein
LAARSPAFGGEDVIFKKKALKTFSVQYLLEKAKTFRPNRARSK